MISDEFNLSNYMYLSKISRYREIYERSVKPVEAQLTEVEREIDAYNLRVKCGHRETPLTSGEASSIILFPEEEKLHHHKGACIDVIENINKNTIVNIYHFWERYWFDIIIGKELSGDKERKIKYSDFQNYNSLKKIISKHYEIDEKIEKIKNIANSLKHGNRRNIRALLKAYPDLFERKDDFFISCFGADAISIKRADIEEAFEILSNSGPQKPLTS
ncbi:hypothetical protein [Komagataeibacter saccharivorans]|uniref:Uncharacterized protein n=1 Tax=Komagataeibacter saccharivorans TaxID=265959 RepID=A0A347WH12_9PROT|nr:hypothetical protein [Komagataeibacter saccharivorans]AXY24155.1 hypothetical protein CD178_03411 [Komagataeibacter saccharivorans]QBL95588.1 hypothetical protein KSAC_34090 [Komagataeibacter saccharivorans]GBQ41099.1 hypothetical protein AA0614_2203 [Komagataeibacter saccharivorans NRIC 0614]